MGQVLQIPRLIGIKCSNPLEIRDLLLENGEQGTLESQTWEAFHADPREISVHFSIAYRDSVVMVLFQVEEPEIRATFHSHGDLVFNDSCVEFFISDAEGTYLNVECNPFGAVLSGIGRSRHERLRMGVDFYSRLGVWTSIDRSERQAPPTNGTWEILLQIPLDVAFKGLADKALKDLVFSGNLYKCGDLLQHPHYISWAPIHTDAPDFHQSSFFGKFEFLA